MQALKWRSLNWGFLFFFGPLFFSTPAEGKLSKIAVEEYRDRVYAEWLAQCVGNIHRLPHENKYINNPGPDQFPLGNANLRRVRGINGAFSDDDTDFEYMYLRAMEKYGIEPTIHYAAMYAAAFFESDIHKLIDTATAALPPNSRFAKTVEDMKALFRRYPHDWKAARREMAQKYYHQEPFETRTIWNANLNGACGILALLYGGGDFQKTLDLACALGFDADNQAATISGLLGAMQGTKGIPHNLLFPFPDLNWKAPFNDLYKNVSRYDLPDGSLKDMARRTVEQAEKIILKYGGKRVVENGIESYLINPEAQFVTPLEFPQGPMPVLEVGSPASHEFVLSGGKPPYQWSVVSGAFPKGLQLEGGKLTGVPVEPGIFPVSLQISQGGNSLQQRFRLVVLSWNLAPSASRILANVPTTDTAWRDAMWLNVGRTLYAGSVQVIRDGKRYGDGSVFYAIEGHPNHKTDYYGYEWTSPQNIGLLSFHTGSMEECGGWFQLLQAEYRDPSGNWRPVENLIVDPPFPSGNDLVRKPHFVEYLLAFKPVQTTAIRIIGKARGIKPFSGKEAYFTSITELAVYAPLPN